MTQWVLMRWNYSPVPFLLLFAGPPLHGITNGRPCNICAICSVCEKWRINREIKNNVLLICLVFSVLTYWPLNQEAVIQFFQFKIDVFFFFFFCPPFSYCLINSQIFVGASPKICGLLVAYLPVNPELPGSLRSAVFLFPFFYDKLFSLVLLQTSGARSWKCAAMQEGKRTAQFCLKREQRCKSDTQLSSSTIFVMLTSNVSLARSVEPRFTSLNGRGSILSFGTFLISRMRSEPSVELTKIHDVILIQSHMYFDAESNNLRFGFQLWHCLSHGPDSPQEGPSLGQLEPHGSWGFLPKGEAACTLRGNWWMSSRKNGKRTAGTPDGTCGQPGRGDYSLDPWWFSSTRPGGSLFLRHMMPGGLAVPRTGDSSAGGSTRPDWSGYDHLLESQTLPGGTEREEDEKEN